MAKLPSDPDYFERQVEKLTSELWIGEDWEKIVDLCFKMERIQDIKDFIQAIINRIDNKDSCTAILAITLLDICSGVRGKKLQLQIASPKFETELRRLVHNGHSDSEVCATLLFVLQKWANGDYKTNPRLHAIVQLYETLKNEGYDFSRHVDMYHPWSFKDKHQVKFKRYKFLINNSKKVLEKVQVNAPGAWIKVPFTLDRCNKMLEKLRQALLYGAYNEFQNDTEVLKIQNELSDIIETCKSEMKKIKRRIRLNKKYSVSINNKILQYMKC